MKKCNQDFNAESKEFEDKMNPLTKKMEEPTENYQEVFRELKARLRGCK